MEIKPELIITGISAVLGSSVIGVVIGFFQQRKKLSAEGEVAQSTKNAQIGLVSVQELEAKLGYLNRVITVLEQHNVRLEGDLDATYQMNTQLSARVRELTHRCDQLEALVRKLCFENGLNVERYLD